MRPCRRRPGPARSAPRPTSYETQPLLSDAVTKHNKDRRDDRGDTDIDGQQLPDVLASWPARGRREAKRQQPEPPQSKHIDRPEQPRRPRPLVEDAQPAGE